MKSIYLIPNLLTLCNLLCGYWSITLAGKGQIVHAAYLLYFSILFDICDGRIARLTGTTSQFGLEFDSIADVVSFGLAPAFILYRLFSGNPMAEKLAWWGCLVYVVCGALRLARYNVQSSKEEKHDFTGLPIPCAAGMIGSYILFMTKINRPIPHQIIVYMLIPLALLMVSTIHYPNLRMDFRKRKPFDYLVAAVVLLGLLVHFPQYLLFIGFFLYIMSGIFVAIKAKFSSKLCLDIEKKHS